MMTSPDQETNMPSEYPPPAPAEVDSFRPVFPASVEDLGIPPVFLAELTLKTMAMEPNATTSQVAARLRLGTVIADLLLHKLVTDKFLEIKGLVGMHNHRYAMLERGWAEVSRVMSFNNYVGPAPVSLSHYSDTVTKQVNSRVPATRADVESALGELVLTDTTRQVLGLVASSGRSLFLSGSSGNGKTAVARALVNALTRSFWIPHAIEIDGQVIRLYDQHAHQTVPVQGTDYDQRWIKIKPPLVVVGGELTIESMELTTSPAQRFYEAPFQLKSNGGVLVVDDLGRQRCSAEALLNRWIIPLENRIDYLTLNTGKKIQVPFEQIVIFSTNLQSADLSDEAFMRRMGYRICVTPPNQKAYAEIFTRYAAKRNLTVDPALLAHIEQRYAKEKREPKACEPRDIIDRAMEVCRYNNTPVQLTKETVNTAWEGYFGIAATG